MNFKQKSGFRVLRKRLIHRGRVFELNQVFMRAPNGRKFQHDVIFHRGAAVVIPLLERDQFVLLRQYRPAVGQELWEFPAGTLEESETPLACAKREIVEEIGYEARRWKKLATFYPAPGVSTELMHLFLATGLCSRKGVADTDEFLKRVVVPFERLKKMVLTGEVLDAKTLVGFFYYCGWRKRELGNQI